jgi:hypothetical protein
VVAPSSGRTKHDVNSAWHATRVKI